MANKNYMYLTLSNLTGALHSKLWSMCTAIPNVTYSTALNSHNKDGMRARGVLIHICSPVHKVQYTKGGHLTVLQSCAATAYSGILVHWTYPTDLFRLPKLMTPSISFTFLVRIEDRPYKNSHRNWQSRCLLIRVHVPWRTHPCQASPSVRVCSCDLCWASPWSPPGRSPGMRLAQGTFHSLSDQCG